MTFRVRHVLVGLALAFTGYLAGRGLWWTAEPVYPAVVVAALVFYLAATWLCLTEFPRGSRAAGRDASVLPMWAAVLAIAAAVVVPNAVSVGVGPDSVSAPFATWYIGGVGALMTIVVVRRRPWFAWVGMAVLSGATIAWLGLLPALSLGLIGSIVWVIAAQLLVTSIHRAERATEQLTELQGATSAWQASQVGRRRERRTQVQHALAVAGPILARTIATGGALDEAGRSDAEVAEGRLRDELRAPRLLNDDVRDALAAARRRGATVTVTDDGGLKHVEDADLEIIRAQIADAVAGARSGRLFIRTSEEPTVAVTVVGRGAEGARMTDEDGVDVFVEIPYPS